MNKLKNQLRIVKKLNELMDLAEENYEVNDKIYDIIQDDFIDIFEQLDVELTSYNSYSPKPTKDWLEENLEVVNELFKGLDHILLEEQGDIN